MSLIIPTQPLPAQVLEVLLETQAATIEIRQLSTGLYLNLLVSNVEIVGFVVCRNFDRIVRNRYLGFQGDLIFMDNTGQGRDPFYTGLGTDFSLVYIEASELLAAGVLE